MSPEWGARSRTASRALSQRRLSLRPARPGNGVGRRADLEHGVVRRASDAFGQVEHGIAGLLVAHGVSLESRDRDRAELYRLAVLLRPHRCGVVCRIARL